MTKKEIAKICKETVPILLDNQRKQLSLLEFLFKNSLNQAM